MNTYRVILIMVAGCMILGTFDSTGARAQDNKQKRCATPEYHQFDFWIGRWDTFETNDSKVIARNRVESMVGGCAIREVYEQGDGLVGESFSIYDAKRGVWHQSWVTNHGQLLVLEGGFVDGKMILTGDDYSSDGQARLLRGIWQRISDGVRETAETSSDAGKTWRPLFDIVFRPANRP